MFLDFESFQKMTFPINQEDPLPSLAVMVWGGQPHRKLK